MNFIQVGSDDAERYNFTVLLLSDAHIDWQTFSALVGSLVNNAKHSIKDRVSEVCLSEGRAQNINRRMKEEASLDPSNIGMCKSQEALKEAISASNSNNNEESATYISLDDAMVSHE